ncbi:CDP-2,3-bis-(O-geranylgeranyl)-sn-glycerol synthase [Candidatus Methylobacter favarea]|uniref:CDP-2,3-bis-(O-geranylgeranyl)-sn-glycerol synthase n=1 Tax=Candidatus Methylobacter favarea TaxID=2707345 RepID=A0A8S0WHN2_9GAMM|nr:CDP-archaeol synthase [Candidatus Methylobacter favarea]CAA9889941.1 CDP-2,3-bis-(O-geranylgeranyl)-sn-glycerol synthase [Candidatus Methylobacter favarea]
MINVSLCPACIAQTLVLLLGANGAPILIRDVLKERFNMPVDMGKRMQDGYPLFGRSKTWCGIIASLVITALAALAMNLSLFTGVLFSLTAMSGDLLSSFIKRRLGYSESSRARPIDVIPESFLPALALHLQIGLGWMDILAVGVIFFLAQFFLSPVLYRLRLKNRPY